MAILDWVWVCGVTFAFGLLPLRVSRFAASLFLFITFFGLVFKGVPQCQATSHSYHLMMLIALAAIVVLSSDGFFAFFKKHERFPKLKDSGEGQYNYYLTNATTGERMEMGFEPILSAVQLEKYNVDPAKWSFGCSKTTVFKDTQLL